MAGANFSLMDLVRAVINRRQAQNMEGHAPEAVAATRKYVTGQGNSATQRPSGQLSREQEIAIIQRNRARQQQLMEQLQAAERR